MFNPPEAFTDKQVLKNLQYFGEIPRSKAHFYSYDYYNQEHRKARYLREIGEWELFCEHYGNVLAFSGNMKQSLDEWSRVEDFPFQLLVAKTLEAYKEFYGDDYSYQCVKRTYF